MTSARRLPPLASRLTAAQMTRRRLKIERRQGLRPLPPAMDETVNSASEVVIASDPPMSIGRAVLFDVDVFTPPSRWQRFRAWLRSLR